jgi:hypothetical protein
MPKNLVKIEVLQEGDERFLLQTFADGSEERKPIVKLPWETAAVSVSESHFGQV